MHLMEGEAIPLVPGQPQLHLAIWRQAGGITSQSTGSLSQMPHTGSFMMRSLTSSGDSDKLLAEAAGSCHFHGLENPSARPGTCKALS